MEPRISLLTLGVTDLQRAIRFYEVGLGWPRSSVGSEDVAFFRTSGCILALYRRDLLAVDAGRPNDGSGFPGFSVAHNVRTREEVDRIMSLAAAAGAVVTCPAEEKAWGGYSGYFSDPEGFPWEIAWNPGFPLADNGTVLLPD